MGAKQLVRSVRRLTRGTGKKAAVRSKITGNKTRTTLRKQTANEIRGIRKKYGGKGKDLFGDKAKGYVGKYV